MFPALGVDMGQVGISQNISDLSTNLIVGYKFYVFIGPISLAFNRVSGIENTYNYRHLQEGGVNDSLIFLQEPVNQPSTLVFEDGGMQVSLVNMKLCFDSSPKEVLVLLCTASGDIKNIIAVQNAVISKVDIENIDAEESKLVVNKISMIYTGFSRINFNVI